MSARRYSVLANLLLAGLLLVPATAQEKAKTWVGKQVMQKSPAGACREALWWEAGAVTH